MRGGKVFGESSECGRGRRLDVVAHSPRKLELLFDGRFFDSQKTAAAAPDGVDYLPASEMLEIWNWDHTRIVAYVLQFQPHGFIVVTPDDEINPVIAYSERSVFDESDVPDNTLLHLLRDDVGSRIRALERGRIRPSARQEAQERWNNYLRLIDEQGGLVQKVVAASAYDVEEGPFLASEWGQWRDGGGNAAFNYYTPNMGDGDPDNYVCGCVATAMAQVLNYYEWPITGTGSHSYTWDNGSDPPEVLSADFDATAYDWPNTFDVYHDGSKTLTERQAVGLLTSHCGIAVDMDYAPTGSGAYTDDVADAFPEYFRSSATWVGNSDADLFTRLYDNMIDHRPAILSIRDTIPPTAGHAIVSDGIRHNLGETKYYHLNMGWNGSSDAWYDIENPPFTTGSYTWDVVMGANLDILPTPDMLALGDTSVSFTYDVSWDVSDSLRATKYELQQLDIPSSPSTYSDGAESGTGDWTINNNWEASDEGAQTGTYSFRGYFSSGVYTQILESNYLFKIGDSTNISYYWKAVYFEHPSGDSDAQLQISTDGVDWKTLKTHAALNTSWAQEIVSSDDLSAYNGEFVNLRFKVEHYSGYYYLGTPPQDWVGFFLDDFTVNNGYFGTWATVDNNIATESKSVTVSSDGDYAYRVRADWNSQWWDWSDYETITVSATRLVEAKVFLEGAYDTATDSMSLDLYTGGNIPTTTPYTEDDRSVSSVPADVVDWVLVQLRSFADGAAVASRSAFLSADGRVVDDDGTTGQIPLSVSAGDYFLVVRHRNHLAVMSNEVHTISNGASTQYDFSSGSSSSEKHYGTGGAVELETNVWGTWSGDINQDGEVTTSDYTTWYNSARAGDSGYKVGDCNCDCEVTTADYTIWYNNARAGASSAVPNL